MFDISLFQYQTVVYKNQWVWRSMNTGICWEYVIIVDRLIKKRYIYFPQQCSKRKTLFINVYVAMYLFYSYVILIRACALYNYFLDIQWTSLPNLVPIGPVVSEMKIQNRQPIGSLVSFVYFRSINKKKHFRGPSIGYATSNLVPIGLVVSEKKVKI